MREREPHSYDRNEAEIVRRAQKGDELAYTEIFRHYYTPVRGYIIRNIPRNDPDTADDLAQTTFLKVFTALSSYRKTESSFEAWMMTIARNVVVDFHRHQGRTREELPGFISRENEERISRNNPNTERIALARIALQRVMQNLTPEERATLPVATGEITSEEFGRTRGESSGASRKRIHGMRKRLRGERD